MTPIDRSPSRPSSVVAFGLAVVAATTSGLYSWVALVLGGCGVALVLAGIARGSRSTISAGSATLFVGAVTAGTQGAPAGPILVSVTATVLAWDAGTAALEVGAQLGREAPTARVELTHLAGSAGVGVFTAGFGYLVYATATGGQPLSTLVVLVVATVVLLPTAYRA